MPLHRQSSIRGMSLRQPATRWQDALPTGNGSVGALVYGNLRDEQIVLNHEALWLRSPRPKIPDISAHLPQARRLLARGRYRQAAAFLDGKLREGGYSGYHVDPYQPAFDLMIDTETRAAFTGYRRELDFASGVVTVRWRERGRPWSRDLFVSRADDVVVLRFSAPGRVLSCRLGLAAHDLTGAQSMGAGQDQSAPAVRTRFKVTADGRWLTITGRLPDGREFGGVGLVHARGGTVAVDGERLRVTGAGEALVVVKLFVDEAGAPARQRLRAQLRRLPADYRILLRRHVASHAEMFGRLRLELGESDTPTTNDDLLARAYDGVVPTALIQRLFDFGRFLLIGSSRPGGWPVNLQGVWNGDYQPAWSADYHNDENVQMAYWQALPGNLAETALPFFDYYERHLADFRANARRIYGCRGILAPVAQSTHGLIPGSLWYHWTAGAGWLAQLFYDYWLFTGDRAFLRRRAVPFMKEVAIFYEDFLVPGPDGRGQFSPSLSPENSPTIAESSLVTINATMDVAVARELLANLCQACELLDCEAAGVRRWRALLARLPVYQVNEDGALREWLHPELKDNYHQRHLSHLYPIFPGREITNESDPTLFAAGRTAVEKRLVIGLTSQTGWSLAHLACTYARLGEGDRALECLELMTRSCVGPNLFTYHNDWRSQGITMFWGPGSRPPFQIDANLGFTAAILEMLAFTSPDMIKVLPALPRKWPRGRIEGLRCRGGGELDLAWERNSLRLRLRCPTKRDVTIAFPHPVRTWWSNLPTGSVAVSPLGAAYRRVRLPAKREVEMEVGF